MSEYKGPSSPGIDKIRYRWAETNSLAGVGIDPVVSKIPDEVWDEVGGRGNEADGITLFCQRVIDATHKNVVDYKVNTNFFQGSIGKEALANVFSYLKNNYPNVLRVADGKFGDVGHTAEQIADEIFGELDADAVLLNPYMGYDAIKPFSEWRDKLSVICVNTSNPSANSVQNLALDGGGTLWQRVLDWTMNDWNENNNLIPVLSATHPENIRGIRSVIGDVPVLLAGVGAQGGSIESTVPMMLDSQGNGLMISSSRGILYPERRPGESFDQASGRCAEALKRSINIARGVGE